MGSLARRSEVSIIINTLGAMYIGAMITFGLYGITVLQTYFYFIRYPNDGRDVKLLVITVWTLDSLHVAFVGHAMYHYLVSSFGNPQEFLDGIWSLYASILTNLIMAIVVQCFFTKRLYRLCIPKIKWWLTSVTVFFVVAHFCFGLETVTEFFIKERLDRLHEVTYIAALPFGITAVLSDVLIAAALCFLLAKNRVVEYPDTNIIINRLIVFAINRCILTSAVAIAEVIVFLAIPNSFYALAIDFIIGKLYANSLLATLNSRESLRGKGREGEGTVTAEMSTNLRFAAAQPASAEHHNNELMQVGMHSSSTDDRIGVLSDSAESSKDGRLAIKKSRRPFLGPTETI